MSILAVVAHPDEMSGFGATGAMYASHGTSDRFRFAVSKADGCSSQPERLRPSFGANLAEAFKTRAEVLQP